MTLTFAAIFTTTVLAAIVIIGACVALALGGFYLVVRFRPQSRNEQNNDVINLVFGVLGGLYAILLAFVVVIIWQEFTEAEIQTQTEVTRLSNLMRSAGGFPQPERNQIRLALLDYTNKVATDEWEQMSEGKSSPSAARAYGDIWRAYQSYRPQTDQAQTYYEESISRLNDLGEARRLRLQNAQAKVPRPLWILILLGGALTIAFSYFYWAPNKRSHAVTIGALAALLGFVFFLVYSLEHPFSGDVAIRPDAYKALIMDWEGLPKQSS